VVITDPQAMKALAHPARLAAIDELYSGRELTASELADLGGLTPSAMSYHLRALERWGVVERAEARGDGRERPWRAAGRSLLIQSSQDGTPATPSSRAITRSIGLQALDRLRTQLTGWFARNADDPWREVGRISSGYHYLTREQAAQLAADVDELLARYQVSDAAARKPDRRRVAVFYAQYPVDPPSES